MPRVTGSMPQPAPPRKYKPPMQPTREKPGPPVASAVLTALPNRYQREMQSSGFDDEERTEVSAIIGNVASVRLDDGDDEITHTEPLYDGVTAPKELQSPDTWKAIMAPIQSVLGRRSSVAYLNCIEQFAAGHNPRYRPGAGAASRMHVFVWDVSRAMSCEVPHFVAGRELSLVQTVDWLRFEGHTRGWKKANAADAAAAADQGFMTLVIPRDPKRKAIAVVRPGGVDARGQPKVACTHPEVGNQMSTQDAMACSQFEFYTHD